MKHDSQGYFLWGKFSDTYDDYPSFLPPLSSHARLTSQPSFHTRFLIILHNINGHKETLFESDREYQSDLALIQNHDKRAKTAFRILERIEAIK